MDMANSKYVKANASTLDFKDAVALQFGHTHSGSFLSTFSDKHQKVPPVSHRQECLIKGICGTLDINSNHFGPVIHNKLKKF